MPKFSNFQFVKSIKTGFLSECHYAKVDVTTGTFFKKTKTVDICKDGLYWRYLDTGAFVEGVKVDELWAAYQAKALLEENA